MSGYGAPEDRSPSELHDVGRNMGPKGRLFLEDGAAAQQGKVLMSEAASMSKRKQIKENGTEF